MHHDELLRLIARNIGNGMVRTGAMRWRWDISGDCTDGYTTTKYAAPSGQKPGTRLAWKDTVWGRRLRRMPYPAPKHITVAPGTAMPYELEIITRCRKCAKCRRARSSLWRMRAKQEISLASRNWFGTITLNSQHQMHFLNVARARAARQGCDFDAYSDEEQFRERVRAISPAITNYLKRVRKNSGAPIRYLWVAERHKSGAPHFHMLLHEMSDALPVRWLVLSQAWMYGFTRFKLIDDTKPAAYVSKYLSKDACARVRASLHYGTTSLDIANRRTNPRPPAPPPCGGFNIVNDITETAQW